MNHASLAIVLALAGMATFADCRYAGAATATYTDLGRSHVRSVTAINEVFGDGQKVSAVAIEYDAVIDTSKLRRSDFAVAGKTVTRVYANAVAAKSGRGINGRFVIVELSTAMSADPMGGGFSGPGPGNGPPAGGPPMGMPPRGPGNFKLGSPVTDSPVARPLTATISQTADIATARGLSYGAGSTPMTTTRDIDLVVCDFKLHVYTDPRFKKEPMTYNLFVPRNYDPSKKYPLVLFMPDASGASNNPRKTLTQGLGAIIWATPSEQLRHPCFVLAPQFKTVIVNDNSEVTEQMDIAVDLVKDLQRHYKIDANRIYNTGQSMGGMTSIAMDIKYPRVFAASLLVACQWDPLKVDPMAQANLFIVVSHGDAKAFPGMESITAELKLHGATVSRAACSAESRPTELDGVVRNVLAAKCNVNFLVFKNGNHPYTWRHAFSIKGLRDWMFSQVRPFGNKGPS